MRQQPKLHYVLQMCLFTQEGVETLIKRGVLTSREDAMQLLDVIQREISLHFVNLRAIIQNGAYDDVGSSGCILKLTDKNWTDLLK